MSANKTDMLMRGVGSVDSVLNAVCNLPSTEDDARVRLIGLCGSLGAALSLEHTRGSALAIIAAYLNRDFSESHRLWYVADGTSLRYDYFADKVTGNVIAMLAGL